MKLLLRLFYFFSHTESSKFQMDFILNSTYQFGLATFHVAMWKSTYMPFLEEVNWEAKLIIRSLWWAQNQIRGCWLVLGDILLTWQVWWTYSWSSRVYFFGGFTVCCIKQFYISSNRLILPNSSFDHFFSINISIFYSKKLKFFNLFYI